MWFVLYRFMIGVAAIGAWCGITIQFQPPTNDLILSAVAPLVGAFRERLLLRRRLSTATPNHDPNGFDFRNRLFKTMVGAIKGGFVGWVLCVVDTSIRTTILITNGTPSIILRIVLVMAVYSLAHFLIMAIIIGGVAGFFSEVCARIAKRLQGRFKPAK